MANFNTHVSIAAAGSLAATGICLQAGLVSQGEAVGLFACGTLAGLLPDIDSDHSLPAQWLFRLISLATALLILFAGLSTGMPLWKLLLYAAVGAGLMRYGILQIFAHITVHRGLFHSLPAALLAGLLVVALGQYVMPWSQSFTWLAGAFVCAGYLLHLLLDELFSVNLTGGYIKSSFGTALTLFSPASWLAYLAMYSAVVTGLCLLPVPPAMIPLSLTQLLQGGF
ncbi:MAG: metal-dependent hydrolase [Mariprofundus sp.]